MLFQLIEFVFCALKILIQIIIFITTRIFIQAPYKSLRILVRVLQQIVLCYFEIKLKLYRSIVILKLNVGSEIGFIFSIFRASRDFQVSMLVNLWINPTLYGCILFKIKKKSVAMLYLLSFSYCIFMKHNSLIKWILLIYYLCSSFSHKWTKK
jgi:hypothetical protein